jgi:hypothetical protein
MAFGNLAKALAFAAVALDGGIVEYQGISADMLAFEPGARMPARTRSRYTNKSAGTRYRAGQMHVGGTWVCLPSIGTY